MPTRVVTAHIPIDLAEKVDALAEKLDRPRGWVVKKALAAWVDEQELRDRLTLEALDEASQGLGVDHADVVAWADSLGSPAPLPTPKPR
ncbi:MAG TPA: ribbon-helix-helix domain-containing protein [Chloroflexota bacterium]|jgi:predicted transcriptional regulator